MSEDCKIKSIKAKQILDSKGMPTIEVELTADSGVFQASVPSGVSTGENEAVELRDKDRRGVKSAMENIEKLIAPALENQDLTDQKNIDQIMIDLDGTKNKSHLGANAILAVSVAALRAAAAFQNLPLYKYISQLAGSEPGLPKPSFNMIEGGKHAESGLAFQEFMVMPQKQRFKENLETGIRIYKKLGDIMDEKFGKGKVELSKESAFSPPTKVISQALDFIMAAVEETGERENVKIAIDAAASEFFAQDKYRVEDKDLSREKLTEIYLKIIDEYPIGSLEDPFEQEDFDGFARLCKLAGDKVIIIGDDLTTTNLARMKMAFEKKACQGVIIKPNQIGTVSEAVEAAKLAKSFGWKIMVSHRAGETEDDFIADLAAGIGADFIKSGAPFSQERMAKYDRLAKIEEEQQ
jgi:enolase